ncbi:MAG: DNA-binding protein [Methanobrevibacter sp.]|uniref:DNA-binding protein n=1 Tax=Methanobrevibacter sp. TaxID=66852 RepID=UPI0026E00F47|nr:DNA-binding protein [Methanobrevibacter sp.]MDO5848532.1 DNA-binding protein [Methanobrevibacter sp.]
MSDLDEIRRKRMAELQAQQAASQQQMQMQAQQQMQQQEAQAQFEAQKKQILSQILTSEARNRLANLRLTKPELVNQIEIQLIQSAQAGSLRGKVTDEQLKVLLQQIAGQKREMKITRK